MDSLTQDKTLSKIIIKVTNVLYGKAESKIKELQNLGIYNPMFQVIFQLKSHSKTIKSSITTKQVKFQESLMSFDEDEIVIDEVDLKKDSLQIVWYIINDKNWLPPTTVVKTKTLVKNAEKDVVWTFSGWSWINWKYKIVGYISTAKTVPNDKEWESESKECTRNNNKNTNNIWNIAVIQPYGQEISSKKNSSLNWFANNVAPNDIETDINPIKKTNSLKWSSFHFKAKNINTTKTIQTPGNKFSSINSINYQTNRTVNCIPINNALKNSDISNRIDTSNKKIPMSKSLNEIRKTKLCSSSLSNNKSKSYEILENNLSIVPSNDIYSTDYISKLNYSDIEYDTFCTCVFVSGWNKNNTQLIDDSEEYPSPCQHKECSILASFKPSILNIYQNQKTKYLLDINELTANLAFPLGIKICFASQNEESPQPYKSFLNVIKNEKGESYYIVCWHYFRKLEIVEFDSQYKVNPLKEYTKFRTVGSDMFNEEKFSNNLDIISKFICNETILIPECITLVSRFPFINQMKYCLDHMLSLTSSDSNELINHWINELPIPALKQKISFYLPNSVNIIELINPFTPNVINSDCAMIFEYLSIENIILIFHLIILEQKIVFIDNDYRTWSTISYAFITFIYPYSWVNTYIPVLSLSTVQFLQSIIPFIMGTDEFLLRYSWRNEYIDVNNKNIVYINIKDNTVSLSPEKRKSSSKKKILTTLEIPDIPERLNKLLINKLKDIKKYKMAKDCDIIELEERIKQLFCGIMVKLIGEYNHYSFMTESEMPLFNAEEFLRNKRKEENTFYKELIQTQLFNQFWFNEKILFLMKKNKGKRKTENIYGNTYDNWMIDTSYFKDLITKYNKQEENITELTTNGSLSGCNRSTSVNKGDKQTPDHKSTNTGFLFNWMNLNSGGNDSSTQSSKWVITGMEKTIWFTTKLTYYSSSLLVTPYFITYPLIGIDKTKIEEYIDKQWAKNSNGNSTPDNIVWSSKQYDFTAITDCYRRYFMNISRDNSKESSGDHKEKWIKKEVISNDESNKDILEWLTTICTMSEKNKNGNIIDITEYWTEERHRNYFSDILCQRDILDDSVKKIITSVSLKEMSKTIKHTFAFLRDKEYNNCKLMTLSMFSYCSADAGNTIYWYEEYLSTYRKFKFWMINEFWVFWFENDLKEVDNLSSDEGDDSEWELKWTNSCQNITTKTGTVKWWIRIYKIMVKWHLEKGYIKQVVCSVLGSRFATKEVVEEIEQKYFN